MSREAWRTISRRRLKLTAWNPPSSSDRAGDTVYSAKGPCHCRQLFAPFVWWEAGMTAQHASAPCAHTIVAWIRGLVPSVAASTVHYCPHTHTAYLGQARPPRTHAPALHTHTQALAPNHPVIVKRATRHFPPYKFPLFSLSYKSPTKTRLPYKTRLSVHASIGEYLAFRAHPRKTQVTRVSTPNPHNALRASRELPAIPHPIASAAVLEASWPAPSGLLFRHPLYPPAPSRVSQWSRSRESRSPASTRASRISLSPAS